MDIDANNVLSTYKEIASRHFWEKEIPNTSVIYSDYYDLLKPEYHKACDSMKNFLAPWNALLAELGDMDWVDWQIRDMSYNSNHIFKGVIMLKCDNKEKSTGIIFHLSLIGNQIGIYFSDHAIINNFRPIEEALYYSAEDANAPVIHRELSYFPLNDLHVKYKPALLMTIKEYFPDFTEFDNQFAESKMEWVQLEWGFYHNLDMFQVFFGTHIHGVI